MHQPTMPQELLLLCYSPETGRPLVDGTRMACGIAGAMVTDLALNGRVVVADDRITTSPGAAATGDPYLDEFLGRIATQKRPRTVKWWVRKTQSGELRAEALHSAVIAGLLRHEERRVLAIFPMNDYFPSDPQQRADLWQRMAAALTWQGHPGDHRAVALLALCDAVGAGSNLFPDLPGRERRKLMKRVTQNDQIGRAVASVIQSVKQATAGAAAGGDGGGDGGGGGG